MTEWLGWIRENPTVVWWLVASSITFFLASLFVVPFVVIRIPHDYFAQKRRPVSAWGEQHLAVRAAAIAAKNIAGVLLLLLGLLMLVLPGQGIMAIVMGIMLMNFPGKFRLERWLVSRRPVLRSINALRRRAKRRPLLMHG